MAVRLSEHFTFKKLLKITVFPIVMMVFLSLYSIVDGIFVANFAGQSSFAAVNLIFPFIMILGSLGFMLGTGGTALVSKYLGQGEKERANSTFSLIAYTAITLGVIASVVGFFVTEPVVNAMASLSSNSTEEMVKEAILYGKILCAAQIFFILQNTFQSFFMVAEKPNLGFIFTLSAGLANMALDALFIGAFRWGVAGAALATTAGYIIGGVGPIIYFAVKRDGIIFLGKTRIVWRDILQTMYNGMSEFIGNIATSAVSIVYNAILLKTYGENGVSAYGIIMYVSFVFMAIFIGYSIGVAPVVAFNYGAKNHSELQNVFRKSLILIGSTSLVMLASCFFAAEPFAMIFSNGQQELLDLSAVAMKIYSVTFLFVGLSIFTSSFFTALNNGTVSAVVSLLRTLVFQIGAVFLFQAIFGGVGIWWAIVFGEGAAAIISVIFLIANKKKYHY
ncbi:MAG: polysaccharide biosynthesis C-terminal domain-containing protein [Bacilli bacterium]|nr:polysaccharide biosynthesis C-terminal domain-containing protein [Bacilli bacterium]